jgi:hypothetical protein
MWRIERNQYACAGRCFTRIFDGKAISVTNRIAILQAADVKRLRSQMPSEKVRSKFRFQS